ncbi:MAG: response regulator [Planctomycetes bacterium]|nr:response regulator [Planctomycetota bacterium]
MLNKRVLVVEDDNSVRCMLMSMLTAAGYAVSAVDNGLDFLRLAQSYDAFDLLVVDIMLPKGEGHDMLAVIRDRGIDIPAIAITALAFPPPVPEDVPVFSKPFKQVEFIQKVKEMLNDVTESLIAQI